MTIQNNVDVTPLDSAIDRLRLGDTFTYSLDLRLVCEAAAREQHLRELTRAAVRYLRGHGTSAMAAAVIDILQDALGETVS
jgi:hypothetical protein